VTSGTNLATSAAFALRSPPKIGILFGFPREAAAAQRLRFERLQYRVLDFAMAETVTIAAQHRDSAKNKGTGTRVSRKIRAAGRVPAIVYGHKQKPQPVSVTHDDVWMLIKKKAHVAQLSVGDQSELVLVRDIQWDHLGKEILHVDFARVSADEKVETEVPLAFHGVAIGTTEGGMFEVVIHNIPVRCLATAIPDSLRVEIGDLKVGQGIHVSELVLPEGLEVLADPEQLVAHVVVRSAEPEPAAGAEGPAEPEVIGRKPGDEKEADEKGKDSKGGK
jgi:large subunit ribosomal protein L25